MRQASNEATSPPSNLSIRVSQNPEPTLNLRNYPRLMLSLKNKHKQVQSDFVIVSGIRHNQLDLLTVKSRFRLALNDEYQATIVLPNGFQYQTKTRISWIQDGNDGFGLILKRLNRSFREKLGQILFRYGPHFTPMYITGLGLNLKSVKDEVKYQIIEQDSEYQQVLTLRHEAYKKAGKLASDQSWLDMRDEYDSRSIILVAKHHDKIIASMRLILNTIEHSGEHEKFIEFPARMPARDAIIEITRVCTDPDYRGCDLLQGLFQYASKIALTLDREWILGSSTPGMLRIYRRIGFRSTKLEYIHQGLNQRPHVIFLARKSDILYGRSVSPVHWYIMYKDIYQFAKACQLTSEETRSDRLRLSVYYLVGRVYEAALNMVSWFKWVHDLYHDDKRRAG